MAQVTFDVPLMYGDHHVVEVRRLLTGLSGVHDIYASSGFHVVEIEYDETQVTPEQLETVLSDAGYMGELPVLAEIGAVATDEKKSNVYFRHTAAFTQTGTTIGFAQEVTVGRPLWPCPGIGVQHSYED